MDKKNLVTRRVFIKKAAAVGAGTTALGVDATEAAAAKIKFARAADVVIVGAGASGLAAAIRAVDLRASVMLVEANFDIGGHLMLNGGNLNLGGGTSHQKRYGIQDSADQVFLDHTRPDHPLARYNDRDIVRAFADNNAATFEFLLANGAQFEEQPPVLQGAVQTGAATVPRQQRAKLPVGGLDVTINGMHGSGLARPLEASARKKGVEILLLHKMTSLIRENPTSGRVLGITATTKGKSLTIQARKAVIIATGGHTGNVEFRRIFDPRLTEEYQQAGAPYTMQNADGENAALAIGASLWGTANQTNEAGAAISKTFHIGCRYGYRNLKWKPESPIFKHVGASGLTVMDWHDVILVNQTGLRFWNELDDSYDFFAACMGSVVLDGGKSRVGGPIWAIFDSDAVKRERWVPTPPNVDLNGYFFSGDTLAELASKVTGNEFQRRAMPGSALEETVARYNSFVDAGADADFNKPTPKYKIQTPPFYAAWATPMLHDSLAGLRVNAKYQVIDRYSHVIPGLYCAGESAGGFAMHGMAKCLVAGYIAGLEATLEFAGKAIRESRW